MLLCAAKRIFPRTATDSCVDGCVEQRLTAVFPVEQKVCCKHVLPRAIEKRNLAPPVRARKERYTEFLQIRFPFCPPDARVGKSQRDLFSHDPVKALPVKRRHRKTNKCKAAFAVNKQKCAFPPQRDTVRIPAKTAVGFRAVGNAQLQKALQRPLKSQFHHALPFTKT